MKTNRELRIEKDNKRIQKVREDNHRVITEIYEECDFLIKVLRGKFIKHSELDIKEAYQEAFLVFYQNIKSGKLSVLTVEIKEYINQIMSYKVLDQLYKVYPEKRKRLHNSGLSDTIENEHIIPLTRGTEQYSDAYNEEFSIPVYKNFQTNSSYDFNQDKREIIVSETVKGLKEPCKTILSLFYFHELSLKEMVGKVDGYTSVDALKTKSYKCKKGMEEALRVRLKVENLL